MVRMEKLERQGNAGGAGADDHEIAPGAPGHSPAVQIGQHDRVGFQGDQRQGLRLGPRQHPALDQNGVAAGEILSRQGRDRQPEPATPSSHARPSLASVVARRSVLGHGQVRPAHARRGRLLERQLRQQCRERIGTRPSRGKPGGYPVISRPVTGRRTIAAACRTTAASSSPDDAQIGPTLSST